MFIACMLGLWIGKEIVILFALLQQQLFIGIMLIFIENGSELQQFYSRMGLFFHELDADFHRFGTQNWTHEGSMSSPCLFQAQFIEKSRATRQSSSLSFSLTNQKIYQTGPDALRSLELSLTALQEHFYLQKGKKVYQLRLIKDDLLTTLYTFDQKVFVEFYSHLARVCVLRNFDRHFRVSRRLGAGSFSVVYEGRSIFSSSQVALKVFDKKKLLETEDGFSILKNEIVNLEKLRKFNLSPLLETYETEDCVILVLKKAESGHMIDYIKEHTEQYDEKMAQNIMKKVFENLRALHSAGFIHRDIKPENILFDSHANSFHLFLADFGLSVQKNAPRNSIGKKCSGTLGFVAPEVLHGNQYDEKCDIFSAGCLLYFLLTGKSLFSGMSIEEIIDLTYDSEFINRKLNRLSTDLKKAKRLLRSLLELDPTKRISAEEALKSQFFESLVDNERDLKSKLCGQDSDETIREYIIKKVTNFWK